MKNAIRALALVFVCLPVSVSAQSSFTITGELRDDSGKLFSGGNVCALQPVSRGLNVRDRVCVESDAQGKFVINITQPGTYQVIADKVSEGFMPPYFLFYKDPKTTNPEITLNPDHPNVSVSVRLVPKSGLITGLGLGLLLRGPGLYPFAFAATLAIMSKHLIKFQGKHIFNPSTFGISMSNR